MSYAYSTGGAYSTVNASTVTQYVECPICDWAITIGFNQDHIAMRQSYNDAHKAVEAQIKAAYAMHLDEHAQFVQIKEVRL